MKDDKTRETLPGPPRHLALDEAMNRATDVFEDDEAAADPGIVQEIDSGAGRRAEDTQVSTRIERPPRAPSPDLEQRIQQIHWEIAAASSHRRIACLLHQLGRIYENDLGQDNLALQAFQESFDRFPGLSFNARDLARMLRRKGDFAACISVLEAELSAVSSVEARVSILVEKAEIALYHLSDPVSAHRDLERASQIDADDPLVIDMLASIHQHMGDFVELEDVLRRRARRCGDPQLSSAILCQIARLREEHFRDGEGAATAYRTALNTSPSNLLALQALFRTARTNQDYPAAAKLAEAQAAIESGAAAATTLWSAARIYRYKLRNADLAIEALEQACQHSTADRALLMELADLYERGKHWAQLAATLEQSAALSNDPGEAAEVYFKLGQVRLERLHDPGGAVEAWRRVLDRVSSHLPARRMLGRLLSRKDDHDALVLLLTEELEIFSDPVRRAATAYRIGNIQETKLGDLAAAGAAYELALECQPGFRPAIRGVGRVFSAMGQYEDLISSCERELSVAANKQERLLLLRRISDVWERRMNDPAAAVSSYERLLAIDPSDLPALRSLRRLYTLGSRWQDLVMVLRTDADQALDRWSRVALLTEAAEVELVQLQDREAALQTYLDVLELAPTHQPALMAAGRLLHEDGRFEDLLKVHRRELEHVEDQNHKIWLMMKVGKLQCEKLEREGEAATTYQEIVDLAGDAQGGERSGAAMAAMDQLEQIYRRSGDHRALLQLLQQRSLPKSGKVLSLYHRRIAEVLQRGQRPALALDHLKNAMEAAGDDAALHQLSSIYAAIGDRQNLIALLQEEARRLDDPRGRMCTYHKLARIYGEAEQDLELAVETLEKILEISPRDRIALHQLENQLARLERWEKLAAVLQLGSEHSEDVDHRVACALMIATIREDRMDDLQAAAHCSYEVLERHDTHPEALSTLERHYRRTGNTDGVIQVLSRQLKLTQTTAEQAAVLSSIAAVHGARGEIQEAAKVFRMSAEAMPSFLPAVRGWRRAAREEDDTASEVLALEMEAEASLDPARRTRCYHEAGKLWQQLQDPDRATKTFDKVLECDPLHEEATQALIALHTSRQSWERLITLLKRSVEFLDDPKLVISRLARISDLQRSRVNDLAGAKKTIFRALELDPNDQSLLTNLAELCRAEGDWKYLVTVDERLLELTLDPVLLTALHFELGTIFEDKLPNTQKAIAEYRQVLSLDSSDLGALTRLSELLLREQDWPGAASVTEQLLTRDSDRRRVQNYHLRLGTIYSMGFDDSKRAVESCRRALALDPGDLEAMAQMAHMLSKNGDRRALEAHLASSLAVHRARIERDPFRVDSYRALLQVFDWQDAFDAKFVIQSVLVAISAASDVDRASVEQCLEAGLQPPSRALTTEEIEEQLIHPDERGPLHHLLVRSEGLLRKIHAHDQRPTGKAEKITVRSHPWIGPMINQLKKAVGGVSLASFMVDSGGEMTWVVDSPTPAMFVDRELIEALEPDEAHFMLARDVAHVRLRHMLYTRITPEDLGRSVAATLSAICRSFSSPFPPEELEELMFRIHKALNKRTRRLLESPGLEMSDQSIDPSRWLAAMEQSEDRVAAVLCGNVVAAIACLFKEEGYSLSSKLDSVESHAEAAGPRIRQLLSFVVSEEFLTLRERMGMEVVEP